MVIDIDVAAPPKLLLRVSGECGDAPFAFDVTNATILDAVRRYETPEKGVEALLEIGARAALTAATGMDMDALRKELERAVHRAAESITGLEQRVTEATGPDGVVSTVVGEAKITLASALGDVLATASNPDVPGSLIAKIQTTIKSLDEYSTKLRTSLNEEIKRTTDGHAERVEKTIREMNNLDPNTALGREFISLRTMLTELKTEAEAAKRTSAERARGTAKGADFEALIAAEVDGITAVYNDIAERTGTQTGSALGKKAVSKKGDITCSIDGREDARIVIECKNRQSLSVKAMQTELREAMANRGAQAALVVCASAEHAPMDGRQFKSLGPNMWAVVFDDNDTWQVPLQFAYSIARQTALNAADSTMSLDLESLTKAIDEINRAFALLKQVKDQLTNIKKCEGIATQALTDYERDVITLVAQAQKSLTTLEKAA